MSTAMQGRLPVGLIVTSEMSHCAPIAEQPTEGMPPIPALRTSKCFLGGWLGCGCIAEDHYSLLYVLQVSFIFGLMVKGKAKGSLHEIADASASNSKANESSRPGSPEVEEKSAPQNEVTAKSSTGIQTFAGPSAKRTKLLQQLVKVDRQVQSS